MMDFFWQNKQVIVQHLGMCIATAAKMEVDKIGVGLF